jgi:hypothetical protein
MPLSKSDSIFNEWLDSCLRAAEKPAVHQQLLLVFRHSSA